MTTLDRAGLEGYLAHRGQALVLDGMSAYEPGQSLEAFTVVDVEDPRVEGHFPGLPLFPGVMMVEAFAQASILLLRLEAAGADEGLVYVLSSIAKASFLHPVRPPSRVEVSVRLERTFGRSGLARAEARSDGRVCAKAELLISAVEKERLSGCVSAS